MAELTYMRFSDLRRAEGGPSPFPVLDALLAAAEARADAHAAVMRALDAEWRRLQADRYLMKLGLRQEFKFAVVAGNLRRLAPRTPSRVDLKIVSRKENP